MMDLLVRSFEVDEGRMAIAGYSDTVPVAGNETEDGRSRNRRVDIVILSATGMIDQPTPEVSTK